MITEQNRPSTLFADLIRAGAADVATGSARERFKEMAEFYVVIGMAMEKALKRWHLR